MEGFPKILLCVLGPRVTVSTFWVTEVCILTVLNSRVTL